MILKTLVALVVPRVVVRLLVMHQKRPFALPPLPRLPRLYDSTDDLAFDDEDTRSETARSRSEADAGSHIRSFFAAVVDELEDAFDADEETQPFIRRRTA